MAMLYRCPACDAPAGSCGESECAMVTHDNPYAMCGGDVGCEFDAKSTSIFASVAKGVPTGRKKLWVGSGEDVGVSCY